MFKKAGLFFVAFLMMFNAIGIQSTVPEFKANSEKEELNLSGIVDKIEISPNDLWHGEQTKITVHFSEKPGKKITSNSIITMDYPKDLEIFDKPKDDPIELIFGGKVIGIVYTNKRQLVMEFNENVDHAYNHKGSFHISAKASFIGDTEPDKLYTNEFKTTMGTNAPEAEYKINYQYVRGTSPFFYKPNGGIWTTAPNHVNWWLHINRGNQPFQSDVEITDTIQSGQEFELLDKSLPISVENLNGAHFNIGISNALGNESLTPQEFVERGYGTIDFTSDSSFVLKINKEASMPDLEYTIRYQTRITSEGKYQSFFYNDAIGKYTENGQEVIKEQLNREAPNISSGGTIAPEKGAIGIIKLAKSGDETKLLPGATFKIFNENGSEVDYLNQSIYETDATGTANTPPLDPGKYYITELSAPDFVDFDPTTKYAFEVTLDASVGVQLVISNEVKKTEVSVAKVWADELSTHEDITINLLADGEKVDEVILTNGSLNHTFSGLPKYTVAGELIEYTVSEESVNGYDQSITGNADIGFVVTNTPVKLPGSLMAEKLVSADEVKIDEIFEYTIVVKNTKEGSLPLQNVIVKDTLPEGIIFEDSVIYVDGIASNALVTADSFEVIVPEVVFGVDQLITFTAIANKDAVGELINKATVINPLDPENPEEPEVPVTIIPNGKIAADKRVNKQDVRPGEAFEYTIVVKNMTEGSDAIKDVVVSDTLPSGLVLTDKFIYVDGVIQKQTDSDTQFELTLSEVVFGTDVHVTFEVMALDGEHGNKVNKAIVVDPLDPENPEEPEVPVTVIPLGKLAAEKLVSKNDVKDEEVFEYTIVVKNTVPYSRPLENVIVQDTLPEGIVFAEAFIYVDGVAIKHAMNDASFEVEISEVMYGKDVKVTFKVKSLAGEFGERVNVAKVVNPEEPDNPEEPEVPITITPDGKLGAEKLTTHKTVRPGERFEYSIIVSNTIEGSKALEQVSVTDVLPEGIVFVDNIILVDGVESAVVIKDNSFTLKLDQITYGQPVTITFAVEAKNGTFGERMNVATVVDPNEPENPLEPEVPVTIVPLGKLYAEKQVNQKQVKANETFIYSILVRNTEEGSTPLKNIVVKDTLPEGIQLVEDNIYVNGTPAIATIEGNALELTLSEVVYGKDMVVSFLVKALEGEYGEKVNVATITDPLNPENPEEPEVPVEIIMPILAIEKEVLDANTDGVAEPNETLSYRIKVTNTGNMLAENIFVQDTLEEIRSHIVGGDEPQNIPLTLLGGENHSVAMGDMTLAHLIEGITLDLSKDSELTLSFDVVMKNAFNLDDFPINEAGYPVLQNIATLNNNYVPGEPEWKKPKEDKVVIPVVQPMIQGFKTVLDENDDGIVQNGETLTYTLTAKNIGTGYARKVKIQDALEKVLPYVIDKEDARRSVVEIHGGNNYSIGETFLVDHLIDGITVDIAPGTEVTISFDVILSDKISFSYLPQDAQGRFVVANKALIGEEEPEVDIPVEKETLPPGRPQVEKEPNNKTPQKENKPILPVTGETTLEQLLFGASLIAVSIGLVFQYYKKRKYE